MYKHGGDVFESAVKLDFSININPLGMPTEVAKAIKEAVDGADIYPDYKSRKLTTLLAKKHEICENQIVIGNGASEIILAIARMGRKTATIIEPTFSEYASSLEMAGVAVTSYQMGENLTFEMAAAEKISPCDICFICNPNNPTGKLVQMEVLKVLAKNLKANGGILVVDECFIEFTNGESCDKILNEHPNIIIIRAFTKIYAMAGVRLGYAVCGNAENAEKIKNQLPMWNVSHLAQKGGERAIEKCGDFSHMLEIVESGRKYLSENLENLGFKVFQSDANFILFVADFNLKTPLLERGILVRDASDFVGLSKNTFRICVSTADKNEILIENIKEIIKEITKERKERKI